MTLRRSARWVFVLFLVSAAVAGASVTGVTGAGPGEDVDADEDILVANLQPGWRLYARKYGPPGLFSRAEQAADSGKTCDETYGLLPCSTKVVGNIFLMFAYGALLLFAAKCISDGSELLLEVLDPGLIGGLLLPILGAFPDSLLVVVSGVGGTKAEAQEQVLVGVGVLAGSTILLLTVAWGGSLILGRCDLSGPNGSAKDRTLTKGWHPSQTGVTVDSQTKMGAWIMILTVVPYLVIAIPLIDQHKRSQGKVAALIGLIISLIGVIGYCAYQVMSPWLQRKRFSEARLHYVRTLALRDLQRLSNDRSWGGLLLEDGATPNRDTLARIFAQFDENGDGQLSRAEVKALIVGLGIQHQGEVPSEEEVDTWLREFDADTSGGLEEPEFINGLAKWLTGVRKAHMGKVYKKSAQLVKGQLNGATDAQQPNGTAGGGVFLEGHTEDVRQQMEMWAEASEEEEEEEAGEKKPKTKGQIIRTAIMYLLLGTVLVGVFADPMVDAISGFSKASGIPSFFVAFIVTPLASNASELVSSLIFAAKKKKRTASLTFSQVYGAVTMNNTLCLGCFLVLVYLRGLVWEYSSEIVVILLSNVVVGVIGGLKETLPLWMVYPVLALYPLSLGIVAFCDYVLHWK